MLQTRRPTTVHFGDEASYLKPLVLVSRQEVTEADEPCVTSPYRRCRIHARESICLAGRAATLRASVLHYALTEIFDVGARDSQVSHTCPAHHPCHGYATSDPPDQVLQPPMTSSDLWRRIVRFLQRLWIIRSEVVRYLCCYNHLMLWLSPSYWVSKPDIFIVLPSPWHRSYFDVSTVDTGPLVQSVRSHTTWSIQ